MQFSNEPVGLRIRRRQAGTVGIYVVPTARVLICSACFARGASISARVAELELPGGKARIHVHGLLRQPVCPLAVLSILRDTRVSFRLLGDAPPSCRASVFCACSTAWGSSVILSFAKSNCPPSVFICHCLHVLVLRFSVLRCSDREIDRESESRSSTVLSQAGVP